MKAAILAIGSELLGTSRLDTNSLQLTKVLEDFSVVLSRKSVVGDSLEDLVEEIDHLAASADLLLMTGGLGPTEDDLTREAVAKAFNLEMRPDPAIVAKIEKRFLSRGLKMPEVNRRQANVFVGHEVIENTRGTAPGIHLQLTRAGKPLHVFLFPGVPFELEAMIERDLIPFLRRTTACEVLHRRVLKIAGHTESGVEQLLGDFYKRYATHHVSILAQPGEVQLHLQGSGDEGRKIVASMERDLQELFTASIFGCDAETLESVVGALLAKRNETVSTAESCTGGLLASRITDISGSSGYFLGGIVAYTGEAKEKLAGVERETMILHGQVSEEVGRQLAAGVRERFRSAYGVGITGIAGPGGGTEEKPVGTVHVVVSSGSETVHRKVQFIGSREMVKRQATQLALDMLRRMLVASG